MYAPDSGVAADEGTFLDQPAIAMRQPVSPGHRQLEMSPDTTTDTNLV